MRWIVALIACAGPGFAETCPAAPNHTARIAEIVTTAPAGADGTPGTPCGGCRQRIREFATRATVIHATAPGGAVLTMSIDELLPNSFGPDRLL